MPNCLFDLARIRISRRCNGYYLRWYYNGWHYWLFASGSIIFATEGEKYRTLGTQKMKIGSTQLTEEQTTAIRTIMNTREIYIYTDYGWGAVRVEPGSWEVYNNMTHGYDIEITIVIGSRAISSTGFSPAVQLPTVLPSVLPCELDIVIATQIWMCQNWESNFPGSRVYNDDEDNRTEFKGLYTYDQIMAPGFCPAGWHVPTLTEWQTLITAVGGAAVAGGELKEVGFTHWNPPNTGAVDTYDFAMRSTGWYVAGLYIGLYAYATVWTATPDGGDPTKAYYITFSATGANVVEATIDKGYFFGVRLIKDGYCPVVLALAATDEQPARFTANWTAVPGVTTYFIDVSTDPAFGSFVPGYNNLNTGNVTSYDITGLTPGETYYYRVRCQGGGCTSANSNVITATTTGALLVSAQGNGTGVGYIYLQVAAGCTLTLDGTARFYSDAAGTLNESTTWTPTPGSYQTRYVRCPSGTANLTFNDVTLLQKLGHAASPNSGQTGWGFAVSPTNSPRLTCDNWNFPNCTDIGLPYSSVTTFNFDLTALSPNLVSTYLYPSGTITGDTSDVPATCTILGLYATSNLITGDVADLPAGLLKMNIGGGNTITGDVGDLPSTMTEIQLSGSNTVSGDIAGLPVTMQFIYIIGLNTISGDIADLPASVTNITVMGSNTITGDITDLLDTVTWFDIQGNNTVTGDLVNMPTGMTHFVVLGSNTLSGGFTGIPAGMTYMNIGGSNTVSGDIGDLPGNITLFNITGLNTVTGSLATLISPITNFVVIGSNTISGTIADIYSGCIAFTLNGLNTVSGDIGDLPTSVYYFILQGSNTVSDYTGKSWLNTHYQFVFVPTGVGGLSSAEIDQLLIDMDTDCPFTGLPKTVTLTGTNGAPTAASLAARTSLIAKGVTLTTN